MYILSNIFLHIILLSITAMNLMVSNCYSQNEDSSYNIKLPNRIISPEPLIESQLINKIKKHGIFPIHGIIQLYTSPSKQNRYELSRAGITLKQYLGKYAYYASFSNRTDFKLVRDIIRYCGLLTGEDKIHSTILTDNIGSWAISDNNTIKILVFFFEEFNISEAEKLLKKYTSNFDRYGDGFIYKLELSREQIINLAQEEMVMWIEPGPLPFMPLEKSMDLENKSVDK